MAAGDTYASNVARIYADLGRSQADARLQSGQAWQQSIGQVGQIAANVPGQLADERRSRQQEAIWQANLDKFNQERQEDQWLKDALNSSFDQATGEIDERRLSENLRLMGAAELAPRALQPIREAKAAKVALDNALLQGRLNEAQYGQMQASTLAPYAKAIIEAQGDPAVLAAALAAVRITHGPQMADGLRQSMADNPAGVLPFVQSLIQPTKKENTVVGEGAALVGPDGKVVYENAKPEAAQTVDQMLAAALKKGNREEVNRLIKFKAEEARATRAPREAPQSIFTRAEIVLPDGTIKTANYDSKSGKYTDVDSGQVLTGVGRAPTDKDIAASTGKKQLSGVVSALTELSEKINTQQGVIATMSGKTERAKAAVNLNDDVAEYESIISGFTPIVARAVGHTGVLTQQDVDSVKAMFPRPEDSKTLRDRKVKRLNELMQLGGGADPMGIRK